MGNLPLGVIQSRFAQVELLLELYEARESLFLNPGFSTVSSDFVEACRSLQTQSAIGDTKSEYTRAYAAVFATVEIRFSKPEPKVVDLSAEKETEELFQRHYPNVTYLSTPNCAPADVVVVSSATNPQHTNSIQELRYMEKKGKSQFLSDIITALQLLKEEGVLILRLGDCYTRFTAGLLYIVCSCFASIRICKPSSMRPWMPERFVMFEWYRQGVTETTQQLQQQLLYHLQTVVAVLESYSTTDWDVLELIHPEHIVCGAFWDYLTGVNNALLERELNALRAILARMPS